MWPPILREDFWSILLPPGDYSARAEAGGMSPQISPTIRVDVGAATLLTFKLKVEGPKETVTVTDVPRSVEMNSELGIRTDRRACHQGLAAERAAVHGSAPADARSDAGSARLDLRVEWGSYLWRNSWLQHELPGGWRRQQQRGFFAQAMGRYRAPYQFSDPTPAFTCTRGPAPCVLPAEWQQFASSRVAAFAPNFKTPRVQQGSLSLERELPGGLIGTVSYLYVHGVDMIRARDVYLPAPTYCSYPIYDSTGNLQSGLYNVQSFSTWRTSYSISCPFPPCINTLNRPIAQLGAIDQFESASSSIYHGMTVSVNKRMSGGVYFRLAYTWAPCHRLRTRRCGRKAVGDGAELVFNKK